MTTKTKDKLSKALKSKFVNELKDKKEEERLERIKTNSNLKEVTIFTHKDQQHCKQFTDHLTNEGIKFVELEATENQDQWNKLVYITNLAFFPTVLVNKAILVQRRDFQNAQQLVGAIQHFADPNFIKPDSQDQMFEHMKTNNYNLHMRISQLEGQLRPLITFVQNLQKQLEEEETDK